LLKVVLNTITLTLALNKTRYMWLFLLHWNFIMLYQVHLAWAGFNLLFSYKSEMFYNITELILITSNIFRRLSRISSIQFHVVYWSSLPTLIILYIVQRTKKPPIFRKKMSRWKILKKFCLIYRCYQLTVL
jgi:hypothetical protein